MWLYETPEGKWQVKSVEDWSARTLTFVVLFEGRTRGDAWSFLIGAR